MKQMIKNIVYCLVDLWASVYTYRVSKWFEDKYEILYAKWIIHFIGNADPSVSIGSNLNLLGGKYMEIGANTCIGKNSVLNCWNMYRNKQILHPRLIIGQKCEFGEYTHITCANKINIGDNLLAGRRCLITDNSHGNTKSEDIKMPPSERPLQVKEVVIGNNVWLGEKVTICPGVHIGDGAIIGANAVVTHDIPSCAVAVGVPARVIRIISTKN